jgi:hypothetical protein
LPDSPFDVCPFPIRGPGRRTLRDGEQVAGLVGELDDGGAVALVRRGGDLLILAQLIGKALIVGHFSDKRSYRRPKEIGDSAFVTS